MVVRREKKKERKKKKGEKGRKREKKMAVAFHYHLLKEVSMQQTRVKGAMGFLRDFWIPRNSIQRSSPRSISAVELFNEL